MKSLFLLRGLPGAGKSTLAKSIGGSHIEADMFFMKDGEYQFDPTKLRDAHEWCRRTTETAMVRGSDKVIVSNTFTQEWEMKAYYELAKNHGFTVFSLIVENRHEGVNEHNVPQEALDRMKARFETKLI
jgi:predicted kinase